ncbi:unnamed protein product [Rotaria sordida]|uniref:Uncharacterized protein n=1 Tax=Rotaria sordida TaxID=392033 RepID=A0A814PAH7_9BILA|nr:unnamed protein product [Rotaria sordida]
MLENRLIIVERTYHFSSDRFIFHENRMRDAYDYRVDETYLLDCFAKDKHAFRIGENFDIVYQEYMILASEHTLPQ